nr:putative transformer protein-A [Oncopeltus fasciatus]
MSRQEKTPQEAALNRTQSAQRLPEAENGEKSSSANKSSEEEKKSVFDNKLLKKITVKILRKTPQQSDAVLQRAILNPATIAPVRRPGIKCFLC